MKKTLYILHNLSETGGSITLISRIAKSNRFKDVIVISSDVISNDSVSMLENDVNVILFDSKHYMKEVSNYFQRIDSNNAIVLTFSYPEYLNFEIIKRKKKMSFSSCIYCIQPETFHKFKKIIKNRLLSWIIKPHKKIIEKANSFGQVIFMDQDTLSKTISFYNMNFNNYKLIYLPYVFDTYTVDDRKRIIDKGFNSKIIITCARSDFPFKGYLLGLTKFFNDNKNLLKDFCLKIITNDNPPKELIQEVEKGNGAVQLVGWMSYEELKKEFANSFCYIGMGTTLLDSANVFKISIPVLYNTYEVFATDYFSSNPDYLMCKNVTQNSFSKLLDSLINMNYEEYKNLSIKTYDAALQTYGIDEFVKCLCEIPSQYSILNCFENLFFSFEKVIKKIKKNKKRG